MVILCKKNDIIIIDNKKCIVLEVSISGFGNRKNGAILIIAQELNNNNIIEKLFKIKKNEEIPTIQIT